MFDIHESLKKYVTKLTRTISELESIRAELDVILSNKQLLENVEAATTYEDLKTNLITEDPRDEILKVAVADVKDNELESTVEALEQMLNDDDMWTRRMTEHQKIDKYEKCQKDQKTHNKSCKPNNLQGVSVLHTPEGEVLAEESPKQTKSPYINALTRMKPDARAKVLFTLYQDAKSRVESLEREFNKEEKDELISLETDKLLKIWLRSH